MIYFLVGISGALIGFTVSKILHDKKMQRILLERSDARREERTRFLKAIEDRQTMLDVALSGVVEKSSVLKKEIHGVRNAIEKMYIKSSKKQQEIEIEKTKEMEKYFVNFTRHAESYYTPSLQGLSEVNKRLKNVNEKINKITTREEALEGKIEALRMSSEEKHIRTQEIIQETKNDISKRLDKSKMLARPPQHIICGTLP
tara:strand:+ start:115 stop:717 length:603 start_codon:yes stop_codon:yes gene_type:complete